MNLWVTAFPSLVYLGSVGAYFEFSTTCGEALSNIVGTATGTMMFISQALGPSSGIGGISNPMVLFLSISISLNILLTLMIVIRLILHSKNIRRTMVSPDGASVLYKTITTVLVESSALYAVISLLVVGQSRSGLVGAFLPILTEIQARPSPRPQPSSRPSNVMTDCTGYRPLTHHSTSHQRKGVDEQ